MSRIAQYAQAPRVPAQENPPGCRRSAVRVKITLNGDIVEVAGPLTVSALLSQLEIDSRRVAVEHNLAVLKRTLYESTVINEGDQVEIVNFVGGGEK